MRTRQSGEARAHHFVPQCWLAGFTDTGEPGGMLYVTDLKRKKQWKCKPSEAGHRRDFNRIDDPSVPDPLRIEKLFSSIESDVAPLFRNLTREKRGPKDGFELGTVVVSTPTTIGTTVLTIVDPTTNQVLGATSFLRSERIIFK